jgi:hypothetical protein
VPSSKFIFVTNLGGAQQIHHCAASHFNSTWRKQLHGGRADVLGRLTVDRGSGQEMDMKRQMRIAALATGVVLVISGLAVAQRDRDDDDYNGRYDRGNSAQAQQYGYQSGYRDGVNKGREEGRENDPFDYRTPGRRQATRGYQRWMGPVELFQRGYENGYRSGFESGYQSINRRRGDGDRDDGYYSRGGYGGGYGGPWSGRSGYNSPAYNVGYQDGTEMARHDLQKRNGYNASPRGPFDDRDRGYQRQYGGKSEYKAEYTQGYRSGYESTFRRYGRY